MNQRIGGQVWEKLGAIDTDSFLYNRNKQLEFHNVRTAIYCEISQILKIPFAIDFMRIPIISGHNLRVKKGLGVLIQQTIDNSFKSELSVSRNLASPISIPVPSTFSIFLEGLGNDGLEKSLDSLRNDFTDYREKIVKWERMLYDADSNSDKLEIIHDIKKHLESVPGINLSEIFISTTPNLNSAQSNISNIATESAIAGAKAISSNYLKGIDATSVLYKTINLLLQRRRRNRISYFVNINKEANSIEEIDRLLRKVFGKSLTERNVKKYLDLTKALEKLITISSSS